MDTKDTEGKGAETRSGQATGYLGRCFIVLPSGSYEVRRNGEVREVLCEGAWILAADFNEWLADNGHFSDLSEIIKFGMKVVRDNDRSSVTPGERASIQNQNTKGL